MARKFSISDEVIKVVIVIRSDKKLLWVVFNIQKSEWGDEGFHVIERSGPGSPKLTKLVTGKCLFSFKANFGKM